MAPLLVPAHRVGVGWVDWAETNVLTSKIHRTMLPIPSSVVLASICLSTGRISAAVEGAEFEVEGRSCVLFTGDVGLDLGATAGRWLRPFRRRRKDSLSDFLKDFLRDMDCSPAPEISLGFRVHLATTSLWRICNVI